MAYLNGMSNLFGLRCLLGQHGLFKGNNPGNHLAVGLFDIADLLMTHGWEQVNFASVAGKICLRLQISPQHTEPASFQGFFFLSHLSDFGLAVLAVNVMKMLLVMTAEMVSGEAFVLFLQKLSKFLTLKPLLSIFLY